jgi:hypothetical protein
MLLIEPKALPMELTESPIFKHHFHG